jgi:hypothetical protein
MLSREELLKMWEEVKANQKRLEGCVGPHDFVLASTTGTRHDEKHRCLKCDGVVDWSTCTWYKLGLKHGGRG